MLKRLLASIACLALASGSGAETRLDPPPSPAAIRVLLVSIDGLRPDVLLRADAPVLRKLMRTGSFTMWASTTAAAVTLPSHASMLTGVTPAKHGIDWNRALAPGQQRYPLVPTLLELAKNSGRTTAMAAGKAKFSALAKPGTLDWCFVPPTGSVSDSTVTDTAVAWILGHPPQVLFVHLPDVDLTGHDSGWGSASQLEAVARADRCIGRVLAALEPRLADSTVVLVSADHGGAGKSHGPEDPRSRCIPWIIAGPGIRRGLDLATYAELNVRTEDTAATLLGLLGLELPSNLEGHPVTQIKEGVTRP